MDNQTKEILKDFIDFFGAQQLFVAIEEMSELQKELCKFLRGKGKINNICEEIADVYIMLEQLKLYFEINEEDIDEIMQFKINRTMKFLEE